MKRPRTSCSRVRASPALALVGRSGHRLSRPRPSFTSAFAFAVSCFRKRSRWRAGAFWFTLFLVYVVVTLHDIRVELHQIPAPVGNAYGAAVIPDALRVHGVSWMQSGKAVRELRLGEIAEGVLLAAVLGFLGRRRAPGADGLRLDSFCAGAALYAGSWAFESNFDYRLVFLLLCVPQLAAWRRTGAGPVAWPTAPLLAILVTLWLSTQYPPLPFGLQTWYLGPKPSRPEEAVENWFLFAWLGAALAVTLIRGWKTSPAGPGSPAGSRA